MIITDLNELAPNFAAALPTFLRLVNTINEAWKTKLLCNTVDSQHLSPKNCKYSSADLSVTDSGFVLITPRIHGKSINIYYYTEPQLILRYQLRQLQWCAHICTVIFENQEEYIIKEIGQELKSANLYTIPIHTWETNVTRVSVFNRQYYVIHNSPEHNKLIHIQQLERLLQDTETELKKEKESLTEYIKKQTQEKYGVSE